jgi:hypothetical protein
MFKNPETLFIIEIHLSKHIRLQYEQLLQLWLVYCDELRVAVESSIGFYICWPIFQILEHLWAAKDEC